MSAGIDLDIDSGRCGLQQNEEILELMECADVIDAEQAIARLTTAWLWGSMVEMVALEVDEEMARESGGKMIVDAHRGEHDMDDDAIFD